MGTGPELLSQERKGTRKQMLREEEEGRQECGQTGTRNTRMGAFPLFTLAVSLVVRSKGAILVLDVALSRVSSSVFLTEDRTGEIAVAAFRKLLCWSHSKDFELISFG